MHPLDRFKFCPVCGFPLFNIQDGKSKKCERCGFEYFLNPSASTAAFIINKRNEILVERRGREPNKGTLDLPGGFTDIGETGEEGIAREVKEETGLEITSAQYLFNLPNVYHYSGLDIPTLDFFFKCTVSNWKNAKAADDAAELIWIPLDDIHTKEFGLQSIRKGLRKFMTLLK